MSFPRYQKYKESGVEWIGNVPDHWDVKRIGYYFAERREKVSDKDFAALSVTKNGIVPQLDTAAKSDDGDNRKKVCKGDFVINSRSDRKGSAGASDLDGSVSLICTVLQPQEKVHTPFIHHLLRCQPFQEEFYRNGKGIVADLWSTNYSEMRNIVLGMPPLPEQMNVAAFLDQETAKIDDLVAEQQRLMELLKEKRQAVISHAVTKGLNPNAPMKPSGIEWLGDVPKHWEVMSLRRCVLGVQTGGTPSTEAPSIDLEHGMVWYTPGDFSDSLKLVTSTRKISPEIVMSGEAKVFPPGSVLVVSIGATLGKVGFAEQASSSNQQINAVIPNERVNGYFLAYSLLVKTEVMRFLSNASTIGIMNQEKTKEIWIVVPPKREQEEITVFLDTDLAKLDTLTAEAQRAIDLLQERRTALISAAVTGQIDVRPLLKKEAA
ncbi:MAG: restriction endonuclease subunit S [Alphaproteobacteria bacterium]